MNTTTPKHKAQDNAHSYIFRNRGRPLLSDPGGGGGVKLGPGQGSATHPPTHPTLPPPLGGGVYALHPQSHTSRAELTSKSLPVVGMEPGTF